MSANEWATVLALVSIGFGALIARIRDWRFSQPLLTAVMVLCWAGAAAILLRDLIAMNPPLYAVCAVLTLGMATAVWLFMRLPDPRFIGCRKSEEVRLPESLPPSDATPVDRGPVEGIYQDLVAYWGADRVRVIVAEAAIERNKPDSRSSRGTSAAAHVVRDYIRRDPDHPRQHIEIMEAKDFEGLKERAENRTAEEQERDFQLFAKVALDLVETLEKCKVRDEMRDRDWEDLTTLYGRSSSALTGVPLAKYCAYAEDLSRVMSILQRREHPGKGQGPFITRDLRERLERDKVR